MPGRVADKKINQVWLNGTCVSDNDSLCKNDIPATKKTKRTGFKKTDIQIVTFRDISLDYHGILYIQRYQILGKKSTAEKWTNILWDALS